MGYISLYTDQMQFKKHFLVSLFIENSQQLSEIKILIETIQCEIINSNDEIKIGQTAIQKINMLIIKLQQDKNLSHEMKKISKKIERLQAYEKNLPQTLIDEIKMLKRIIELHNIIADINISKTHKDNKKKSSPTISPSQSKRYVSTSLTSSAEFFSSKSSDDSIDKFKLLIKDLLCSYDLEYNHKHEQLSIKVNFSDPCENQHGINKTLSKLKEYICQHLDINNEKVTIANNVLDINNLSLSKYKLLAGALEPSSAHAHSHHKPP